MFPRHNLRSPELVADLSVQRGSELPTRSNLMATADREQRNHHLASRYLQLACHH